MRSLLFVPADSPRKLEKSLSAGADALIIDLEDSIAAERKADARASALAFLREANRDAVHPRLYVRVNGIATGLTDADLDAIVAGRPDGILLPKAEGGPAVIHVDAKLAAREAMAGIADGHIKVIAMAIETAAGLFLAGTFRRASARLIGLTWGAEDLSAEIGAEANRDSAGGYAHLYLLARSLCLAGAATAEVQAIDTVTIDFRNIDALRRDTEEARRDGFSAKMAIHPAQVPIINEVFTPTPQAIAHAQAVVAAFAAQPGAGVIGLEGVMLDRPHLVRAQQLLARAGQPAAAD
jgi:citrate lyase subunit beta / citryl-CoA lyase